MDGGRGGSSGPAKGGGGPGPHLGRSALGRPRTNWTRRIEFCPRRRELIKVGALQTPVSARNAPRIPLSTGSSALVALPPTSNATRAFYLRHYSILRRDSSKPVLVVA